MSNKSLSGKGVLKYNGVLHVFVKNTQIFFTTNYIVGVILSFSLFLCKADIVKVFSAIVILCYGILIYYHIKRDDYKEKICCISQILFILAYMIIELETSIYKDYDSPQLIILLFALCIVGIMILWFRIRIFNSLNKLSKKFKELECPTKSCSLYRQSSADQDSQPL
jgi:hypothetical protein